jgi:hypothetical protein
MQSLGQLDRAVEAQQPPIVTAPARAAAQAPVEDFLRGQREGGAAG